MRLSAFDTPPLIGLVYQPQIIDDYGACDGMRIGRGNSITMRNIAPVPIISNTNPT
jgi:hypothetical protein